MKLLLILVICLLGTTLAVPVDKRPKKRGILPGDSRLGLEHHHDNELKLTKAIGSHVGSYLVRDNAIPYASYGLPDITPNNLFSDYQSFAPLQTPQSLDLSAQPIKQTVLAPETSYGAPVSSTPLPDVSANVILAKEAPSTLYRTGIQSTQVKAVPTVLPIPEIQTPQSIGSVPTLETIHSAPSIQQIPNIQHAQPLQTIGAQSNNANLLENQKVQSFPTFQQRQPLSPITTASRPTQPFATYGPPTKTIQQIRPVMSEQTLLQKTTGAAAAPVAQDILKFQESPAFPTPDFGAFELPAFQSYNSFRLPYDYNYEQLAPPNFQRFNEFSYPVRQFVNPLQYQYFPNQYQQSYPLFLEGALFQNPQLHNLQFQNPQFRAELFRPLPQIQQSLEPNTFVKQPPVKESFDIKTHVPSVSSTVQPETDKIIISNGFSTGSTESHSSSKLSQISQTSQTSKIASHQIGQAYSEDGGYVY